jgi:rhodanese-related sulfurtransferase
MANLSQPKPDYVVVKDLERLLKDDSTLTLVDARTSEEFAEGHVPGAINVGIGELTEFAESRGDASEGLVVTMCGSTGRGEKAAEILYSHGVENVRVLQGGLKAWKNAGLPTSRPS